MIQWRLGMDAGGPVEVWTEGPKFSPLTYTEPERASGETPSPTSRMSSSAIQGRTAGAGGEGPGLRRDLLRRERDDAHRPQPGTSKPAELALELLKDVPKTDNHMRNWLDCIHSRQRPNGDVEIGHRSATVCHLGNIARWAGRKLQWDPVKERLPAMTTRTGISTAHAARGTNYRGRRNAKVPCRGVTI